jgi:beta-glucosidase
LAIAGGGTPIDLVRQANADLSVLIDYRLDAMPTAPVQLVLRTAGDRDTRLDITPTLKNSRVGEWQVLKVRLASFRTAGADLKNVLEPVSIATAGKMQLTLRALRLDSDPAGAVVLAAAK